MTAFLIECNYSYYCQGTEDGHGFFLVYADSFEEAVFKLRATYSKCRSIWDIRECVNRTVI